MYLHNSHSSSPFDHDQNTLTNITEAQVAHGLVLTFVKNILDQFNTYLQVLRAVCSYEP